MMPAVRCALWAVHAAALAACTQFADLDELRFEAQATSSAAAGGAGGQGGMAGNAGCGRAETITIPAVPGLDGDGYLSLPECGGSTVWDFWPQPTGCTGMQCNYFAIHMGVDPACNPGVVYRLFVRFDLSSLSSGCIQMATLRLFYVERAEAVAYPARLAHIDDFHTLDERDWTAAELGSFGDLVSLSTTQNAWLERDVTSAVLSAQRAAAPFVAFKVQYDNEQHDANNASAWYGVVSADNPENGPELQVVVAPSIP